MRSEMDIALQDCPGSFSGSVDAATQTNFSRKVPPAVEQRALAARGTSQWFLCRVPALCRCVCLCVCVSVRLCVCMCAVQLHRSCQTDAAPQSSAAQPSDASSIDRRIQDFLAKVLPSCEHALQQNETLNIFQVRRRRCRVVARRVRRADVGCR